jgi:hypothetical protein
VTQVAITQPLLGGVWSRRWVTIGRGVRFETKLVVWLQAGPCYADIRVPFHPAAVERCFSGRSGWDGEEYRWTHDLDLEGADSPAADDTGRLTFVEGAVVEHGQFPTLDGSMPYEELWVRAPGSDGPWEAFIAPHACLVRAGSHAITVCDSRSRGEGFAACYRVQEAGRWEPRLSIGDTAALPDPDAFMPSDWRLVGAGHTAMRTMIPRLEQTWTP